MGRPRDHDRHALSAGGATRVAATLARGDDCRIPVAGQNPATRLDVDQAPSRRVGRCVWHGRRPVLGGSERLGATAGDLFHDARVAPLALTQMLNLCFITGKTIQAATLSLAGPGSLPLLAASLPLTVLAIAALLLGIRLQKRMSPDVYSKILRATLAAFVVLLTGQAAIELAHRLHVV